MVVLLVRWECAPVRIRVVISELGAMVILSRCHDVRSWYHNFVAVFLVVKIACPGKCCMCSSWREWRVGGERSCG